jgi:hypothetical protein
MSGTVTYNGYSTDEFVVQRTAAYVDQQDNHIAELTVRSAQTKSAPVRAGHKASSPACKVASAAAPGLLCHCCLCRTVVEPAVACRCVRHWTLQRGARAAAMVSRSFS